jgi:DNA-binding winged helix-turn-helix (wHTH) protein/TolB-like protein/tetratricopeptide (TPR) repeat protein
MPESQSRDLNSGVRFGEFVLDSRLGLVSVKGYAVKLQPQPLRVLELLVERAPEVVTREELGDYVWGQGVYVELDASLNYCIRQIRLALNDTATEPRYVETLPKQGYRLVSAVERFGDSAKTMELPPGVDVNASSPAARRWTTLAAALSVAIIGVVGAAEYMRGRHAPAAPDVPVTLAILPMVNTTGDPANNALADGFTEELIRQASELPSVKVVSRTTVYRYKGQSVDVREVGHDLHVGTVLSERLETMGNERLVNVELSRVDSGDILLSRRYVAEGAEPGEGLLPVKADILRDMARVLGVGSVMEGRGTTNPKAYQAYLRGIGTVQREEPSDLVQGVGDFEEAVRLDPQFSEAWGYLAEAHATLGLFFAPPRVEMPQARRAIDEALRLDPTSKEYHGVLGLIELMYDWDYAAARRELASGDAEMSAFHVLPCSAHLLHHAGDTREAEDLLLRMEADEPESVAVVGELGCVNYYAGNYDAAVAHYREAIRVDPQAPLPYWGLGKSLTQQGRYKEAVEALEAFHAADGVEPPILTAEMGYAFARGKRTAEAQDMIRVLAEQRQHMFVDPYLTAVVYLGLGDRQACFHWLEEAEVERSPFLISILSDPKWSEVRTDPRFVAVVSRMGPGIEEK